MIFIKYQVWVLICVNMANQEKQYKPYFICGASSHIAIELTGEYKEPTKYDSIILRLKKDAKEGRHIVYPAQPFPNSTLISYFEIKLLFDVPSVFQNQNQEYSDKELQGLSFGVRPNYCNSSLQVQAPGISEGSFGLLDGKGIYLNNAKHDNFQRKLKKNDTIGIGLLHHKHKIFLTFNGELLPDKYYLQEKFQKKIKKQQKGNEPIDWYPVICLSQKMQALQITFQNNKKQFKFDIDSYLLKTRAKLRHEIMEESQLTQAQIFSAVRNYMVFYGYSNSSAKLEKQMKKKNLKYGQYTHLKNLETYQQITNANLQEKLEEQKKQKLQQKSKNKQTNFQKFLQIKDKQSQEGHEDDESESQSYSAHSQEQIRSNEELSIEQFIKLKDIWQKMQTREKKMIDQPEQGLQRLKKQREERENTIDEYKALKYRKYKTEKMKQREQYCNYDRIKIIKSIREGKIDVAEKMMITTPNKEYHKHDPYLPAYFKVMTLIIKYSKQGLTEAIKYLQQQLDSIQVYENNIFPFYNRSKQKSADEQSFTMKPIKHIFLYLFIDEKNFSLLKQLEAFSEFIGSLICKRTGYLEETKLEYALEHFRLVNRHFESIGVPGVSKIK